MLLDKGEHLEQGVKRSREAQDSDDGPLVFNHLKRANAGNVLETSKNSGGPEREIPENMCHEEWRTEGLSGSNMEV